jgi:HlyD family secretion protein
MLEETSTFPATPAPTPTANKSPAPSTPGLKRTAALPPADLAAAIQSGGKGKHPKLRLLAVLATIAILVAGGLWWRQAAKARNQPDPYVTELLQRGDVNLTITATGNLEPTTEVTVGSELSGTTLEVYADFNDRVTKGQPLAKLDTGKLAQQTEISRAAVKSAQAKVTQAEATVQESDATLARERELFRILVSPTSDLEAAVAASARARADVLSAQAGVGEAEAQVRINENDLAKAIIKSPIDGIVLTRSIEPGQTVAASFTALQLFIIAEKLERMKLQVTIAEADIGRVAHGQNSSFTVDAWPDRSYTANVSKVSYGSAVKDNVVTYLAQLDVANDDLSLRPGMTATADIRVAASTNVFLVPAAALRFVPASAATAAAPAKKSFVQSLIPMPTRNRSRPDETAAEAKPSVAQIWVLRAGKPESITVKVGLSDGRHTEVSGEGLAEGLAVILRANPPAA